MKVSSHLYMCLGGINFASFYLFLTEFWNCSDSVAIFVLHFVDIKRGTCYVVLLTGPPDSNEVYYTCTDK